MARAVDAMVGRVAEVARLTRLLDDVRGGASHVVLVSGEAGAGKTRLITELERAAGGIPVAIGRCLDAGAAIWPLAPLREILASWQEQLSASEFDELIGPSREWLQTLLPRGGDHDGAARLPMDRLGGLVLTLVRRRAELGPTVIVFEDLHWADESTRSVFDLLTAARTLHRTMIVGTYRSDDLHRRHPLRPLIAELCRRTHPHHLALQPLDVTETAELLAQRGVTSKEVVTAMHHRSGGNPFFLEELLAAGGGCAPSETLRDVVLARANGLDEQAVKLATCLATAGATTPAVLAAAAGTEVTATLAELASAGLVVADGDVVRFRHELAREVFGGEIGAGQRPPIHRALAAALAELRPDRPGEIAYHWRLAGDQPRAFAAALTAARDPTVSAAEAEVHFLAALELWDLVADAQAAAGVDHARLLIEAATAAHHARHSPAAIDLLRRALAELDGSDPIREAAAWLELRDHLRQSEDFDGCADAVTRALRLVPRDTPSRELVKALADAAMDAHYGHRLDDQARLADEAVHAAEALGDEAMMIYARYAVDVVLSCAGDDRVVGYSRETVAMCGPGTPVDMQCLAAKSLVFNLWQFGDFEGSIEVLKPYVDLAHRTGASGLDGEWFAAAWVSVVALLGRWKDADRLLAERSDLLDPPGWEGFLGVWYAPALIRQGRLADASPYVDVARQIMRRRRSELAPPLSATLCEYEIAAGGFEQAVAVAIEGLAAPALASGDHTRLLAVLAGILADADPPERRHPSFAEAEAGVRRQLSDLESDPLGMRRLWLKARIDIDQARAELDRLRGVADPAAWAALAERWTTTIALPYEQAYCRFRLAAAHLAGQSGRSSKAHSAATGELSTARHLAVDLGATPLLARIDELARRARLTLSSAAAPEPQSNDDPLGLTGRERLVLDLLAQGRTNGQIGAALYISTKTASVHVSNILRKLGVTNRVEAAAMAHGRKAGHPAVAAYGPQGPR